MQNDIPRLHSLSSDKRFQQRRHASKVFEDFATPQHLALFIIFILTGLTVCQLQLITKYSVLLTLSSNIDASELPAADFVASTAPKRLQCIPPLRLRYQCDMRRLSNNAHRDVWEIAEVPAQERARSNLRKQEEYRNIPGMSQQQLQRVPSPAAERAHAMEEPCVSPSNDVRKSTSIHDFDLFPIIHSLHRFLSDRDIASEMRYRPQVPADGRMTEFYHSPFFQDVALAMEEPVIFLALYADSVRITRTESVSTYTLAFPCVHPASNE